MDGILIIDKPAGITSHDVVSKVRRVLKTRRVGHTGTLDPFATGVMVVLVGRATRLAQFLDKDAKSYKATMVFGSATDTGDNTGERTTVSELSSEEIDQHLETADWNEIFDQFRGQIEQTPPMYSAKKVAGKKLYEFARQGIEIERNPASVTVNSLEIAAPPTEQTMKVAVQCSAGTYIRTLAEDIGRAAGIPAHLSKLRRTVAGRFSIAEGITLDELAAAEHPENALIPMELAVEHLRKIDLSPERAEKTQNGLATRVPNDEFADGEAIRMLGTDGRLIAIGEFRATENEVKPKVVLV